MNLVTFEMIQDLEMGEMETQIAMQCAPVVTGLKISNLLILPKEMEYQVKYLFSQTALDVIPLAVSKDKITFLLCQKYKLKLFIGRKEVRELFVNYGYKKVSIDSVLKQFSERYQLFTNGKGEFPHEMGLLLGYPVNDVKGFIKYRGKNFLYCGYWKVYCNLEEKLACFREYDSAREMMVELLKEGVSIREIVELYHMKKNKEKIV